MEMKIGNPIDKIKIKSLEKEVERLKAENLYIRNEFRDFEKFAAQLFSKQPAQKKIQRLNKKTNLVDMGNDCDAPESYLNLMLYLSDLSLKIKDEVKADVYLAHGELSLLAANLTSGFDGKRVIYDCVGIPDYLREIKSDQNEKSISHLLKQIYEDNCKKVRSIIAGTPMLTDYFKTMGKTVECIESFRDHSNSRKSTSTIRDVCEITDGTLLLYYSDGNVFQIEILIDSLKFLPDHFHLAIVFLKKLDNQLHKMRLEKKIKRSTFEHRIHVLDGLPSDIDPASFIRGTDLGIIIQNIKSLQESLSLPDYVFDLIAANIPICCTATAHARYIMEKYPHGNLIVRHIPEDLAKCIADLFTYEKQKEPIREEKLKQLSWESQIDNFLKFIGEKTNVVTIIAYNPIYSVSRIVNMAETLVRSGKKVNIVTSGKSIASRFQKLEKITVIDIESVSFDR